MRTVQFAYTALNLGTGDITITAQAGANQVEQIAFNLASTAGNLQLTVQKPDGTFVTTANAAWNATDATYLAAINTQLDASTGVSGGIVATAIPASIPTSAFGSPTAASATPDCRGPAQNVAVFPTTSTIASYTQITAPVSMLSSRRHSSSRPTAARTC